MDAFAASWRRPMEFPRMTVACKGGSRPGWSGEVRHRNADAFDGMTGSLHEIEPAVTELEGVAVGDGGMRKRRSGVPADINAGAGALSKLMVTGDEVGVQVRFDDVLDFQPLLARGVQVDVDVALGGQSRPAIPSEPTQ
jgi:hypothetical protein